MQKLSADKAGKYHYLAIVYLNIKMAPLACKYLLIFEVLSGKKLECLTVRSWLIMSKLTSFNSSLSCKIVHLNVKMAPLACKYLKCCQEKIRVFDSKMSKLTSFNTSLSCHIVYLNVQMAQLAGKYL